MIQAFNRRFASSKIFAWIHRSQTRVTITASILAILSGLLIGFMIMIIFNPLQAIEGLFLITGGWLLRADFLRDVGRWLFTMGPLIMTGLSVGFAFKTGLFNIGATGQYTAGMFAALLVGFYGNFLGPIHWIIAMLAGILAGAMIGLIIGYLKARFNVHEVIASIMFNYIVMYVVNALIKQNPVMFDFERGTTRTIASSAFLPTIGLRNIFVGSPIDIGIVIALFVGILLYIVLFKTTFGFELQATGLNRHAAKYSGINENKSIMLALVIAGALSGLGGTLYFLSSGARNLGTFYEPADILISTGFEGIAVALIGSSNPLGIIFSAGFITFVQRGGQVMQGLGIKLEIIEVIIASILYASAITLIFQSYMNRLHMLYHHKTPIQETSK
jgi:ABC-type uncharacterized transport system permease subunit